MYVTGVLDGTQYYSTKKYDELGLRILPPISPIFAYILLWQKYSSQSL
ncbi:MAG: hypothetical protein IJ725_02340 [Ruminococcus sp.]|nr:hypothetical protein [Ruminococcus sp.]